ncbi:hypothetical protein ACHHYP_20584 [Achlya hypogyna]|uniref:PX domain-containing protein n=1 Tax=Achlya hypogyna TaxID=1202772 RepID=A0A1V9YI73_ACHHY|nr:hypothetical protein ACHHYP_20584 [Achlya hypogyna]
MAPAKDTNIFTKVTAKVVQTKVPPLFSTGLSTTYVIQVHNAATQHHFRIGKTYTDFVVLRDQLLRDASHACANGPCKNFARDVNEHFPPKVIMHRHADVIHLREWKFQDLLDYVVAYINTSRAGGCVHARETVPNNLIVFLFDGAKMDKRKFWIPLQRTHRGRRLPRALLDEALRIAHAPPDDEDDDDNERHMGSIDTILESHGGGTLAAAAAAIDAGSPGRALDVGTTMHDDDCGVGAALESLQAALAALDTAQDLAAVEAQVLVLFREQHARLAA